MKGTWPMTDQQELLTKESQKKKKLKIGKIELVFREEEEDVKKEFKHCFQSKEHSRDRFFPSFFPFYL